MAWDLEFHQNSAQWSAKSQHTGYFPLLSCSWTEGIRVMERVLVIVSHQFRAFEAYWGISELDKCGMGTINADRVASIISKLPRNRPSESFPLDSPGHTAGQTVRHFKQERGKRQFSVTVNHCRYVLTLECGCWFRIILHRHLRTTSL